MRRKSGGRAKRIMRVVRLVLLVASILPFSYVIRDFVGWLHGGDLFRVRQVEVTGTVRVKPEEVEALAGVARGAPIFSVHPADVSRTLSRHPWIRRAVVGRILPDRVRVSVDERRPVALVLREKEMIEIDAEGVLLPPRPGGTPEDLPLISGAEIPPPIPWGQVLPGKPWSTAALCVAELTALRLPGVPSTFRVAELHLDAQSGEVAVVDESGKIFRFMSEDLGKRLPELFLVLQELDRRELIARTIDLRFRDQVVVGGAHPADSDSAATAEGGEGA